ncbi:Tetratricopeptide repeat-containing protein [Hasllibacter halocynthiae]|uniref:Tetratricopeptide repeat-containing protein n=1 Tax=Hasllibacter halocynthiae TaxID=595589 RepID=A0A2T0X723_9RHOB|nr:hypothetical protein [Hasllibacter halocynthiae]PRY94752.1 Tetratricopeptide repeat-containing protein [Hasllibacter halocynthiae]
MERIAPPPKRAVASLALAAALAVAAAAPGGPATAQDALPETLPHASPGGAPAAAPERPAPRVPETAEELLEALRIAPEGQHDRIAQRIERLWSRSGSQSVDYLLKRGRDALEDQDPEAAIDHLSAAIDHAPDFAQPYVDRAEAYYLAGRPGLALYDLRRAIELEPRHYDALAGMGLVLSELDEPEIALEALRGALAIHPAYPDVEALIEMIEAELQGTPI